MHIAWLNIDNLVVGIDSIGNNNVDNDQQVGPKL